MSEHEWPLHVDCCDAKTVECEEEPVCCITYGLRLQEENVALRAQVKVLEACAESEATRGNEYAAQVRAAQEVCDKWAGQVYNPPLGIIYELRHVLRGDGWGDILDGGDAG